MKCSDCSKDILPVVSFDIDGTLGEYHDHFTLFCERYFGREFPRGYDGQGNFEEYLGLPRHNYREAKLAYRQGGTKRWMPAYPEAAELVTFVRSLNVEVWIATTRPWQRLDNIDPDTREWLARNKIDFDGILYGDDKYNQLVNHVDPSRVIAVVDDLAEQLHAADLLGLPPIQRAGQHNDYFQAQWTPRFSDFRKLGYEIASRVNRWRVENG